MVKNLIFLVLFIVFSIGNCQLKSSDFSDGSCTENIPGDKNTSLTFVFTRREYYVPLASKHFYRNSAEVLLGRPANDRNELNQMNVKFSWGKHAILKGYERFVNLACKKLTDPSSHPLATITVICKPTTSSSGTNTSSISEYTSTVVYTDNESAIMVERCILDEQGHGTRDYAVLSPNPILSESVLSACLSTADNLNFDRTHAQIDDYGV